MIWKNSCFQVASIGALISGYYLVYNYFPMRYATSQSVANTAEHQNEKASKGYNARQQEVGRIANEANQNISSKKTPSSLLHKSPQPDQNWTNRLGMKFVPIPGTKVLFGIYDVTFDEFKTFAKNDQHEQASTNWKNPGFPQENNHPVVNVSWDEAKAFCEWLTQKDQESGLINNNQYYRLPTDEEWSIAVGRGSYPWGEQWPPPKGSGNFAPLLKVDDYEFTSPVGCFAANEYGLYDMGANVRQWCEDWYVKEMNGASVRDLVPDLNQDGGGKKYKVIRGGSYKSEGSRSLITDIRICGDPRDYSEACGFRCVLVVSP